MGADRIASASTRPRANAQGRKQPVGLA